MIGIIFCIISAFHIPKDIELYGRNCSDIYFQHIKISEWINNNLPNNSCLAINDAGAIPYFTNKKCFDLIGLGTNGLPLVSKRGGGTLYEYLEKIENKPDYFAVFPGWYKVFHDINILNNIHTVILEEPTISGGKEMEVAIPIWKYSNTGDMMFLPHELNDGFKIVDRIDILDPESELVHELILDQTLESYGGMSMLSRNSYLHGIEVIDGGWSVSKYLEFVGNTIPGKSLKIVIRTSNSMDSIVKIYISDKYAGEWNVDKFEAWSEPEYTIPENMITGHQTKIRFEIKQNMIFMPMQIDRDDIYSNLKVYHIWLMQPE
jgi:hypothetical protein